MLTLLKGGAERPHNAVVRNFSEEGLGLWVDRALEPGALVRVDSRKTQLLCEVIYCQEHGGRYMVGIKQSVSKAAEPKETAAGSRSPMNQPPRRPRGSGRQSSKR